VFDDKKPKDKEDSMIIFEEIKRDEVESEEEIDPVVKRKMKKELEDAKTLVQQKMND
jgi:prolyl oligopeptidase PreP (S9A serine peptidase family)